jgi:hypothetical protein
MPEVRLGDIIDDYCIKCKRIMNHAVVSMMNGEPAKVRCRTCHSDHDYRHELPPPPKIDPRKQTLFNEVLAKIAPAAVIPEPPLADPPKPEVLPKLEAPPKPEVPPKKAAPKKEVAKPKKAKAKSPK